MRPGGMFFKEKTTLNSPVLITRGVGVSVPAGVSVGVRLGPAVSVVVGPEVAVAVLVGVRVTVGVWVSVTVGVLVLTSRSSEKTVESASVGARVGEGAAVTLGGG